MLCALYSTFPSRKVCPSKDWERIKNVPTGQSGQHPRSFVPLKLPPGDTSSQLQEILQQKSCLTGNNLTQWRDMSFLTLPSHPSTSRNNGGGPSESSKACLERGEVAHPQTGLNVREVVPGGTNVPYTLSLHRLVHGVQPMTVRSPTFTAVVPAPDYSIKVHQTAVFPLSNKATRGTLRIHNSWNCLIRS